MSSRTPALLVGALAVLLGLAACGGPRTASPLWRDAAGDVNDRELARLSEDVWRETLRHDPIAAGRLGDREALGLLPDRSPGGRAERGRILDELAARADALDPHGLDADDRVTWQLLRRQLASERAVHAARLDAWAVSPRRGPHVLLFGLAEDQPSDTPEARRALLQRWRGMGAFMDTASLNLQRGLERGLTANRASVETTLRQLDELLAQPTDHWPLANPELEASLSALERKTFLAQVRQALEDGLRPALQRHRNLLYHQVLPRARSDDEPGLVSLPDGRALYDLLIEVHTALPPDADELHRFGLAEVERIRGELAELGERVLGTPDLIEIQRRLREDPGLHFTTRDEVEAAAVRYLDRARGAMGAWFGRLPLAPCEVVRIPALEEQQTTIAYYRGPAEDGSLPGRYFINTFAPETRPRYEAAVLAYHEAIPGHHLQIAIAQELQGLPAFRRHGGTTAYIEGWALYTERLCDEMGLYDDDLDRLGMLSFDAWRACRLVVDTGLHAMGWSRQQAIDYLYANTLLALNNVENEVDRYITTPAQALAYKVGQREILRLRAEARQALGERFDIRAFHDVVLEQGAVTLDILRRRVEDWVAGHPGV